MSAKSLFVLSIVALVACKPSNELPAAVAHASNPPAASLPPLASKADWEAAINATYERSSVKTDKEGMTEFVACFQKSEDGKKCLLFAFGRRDAFRHMTTFTPAGSRFAEFSEWKYLHSYVSVADCKRPVVVLSPRFFSKGGWLFMEKVAVMADGDVLLEHQFANADVRRDSNTWGVDEKASWAASGSELGSLKRIAAANAVIVRLTGTKGYVTVPESAVQGIKDDFKTVIAISGVLDSAALGKEPIGCK